MKWWHWRDRQNDLERELRADLELEAEEQRESDLSPEDAHYAAQRAFGNTALIQQDVRQQWQGFTLERFTQDVRYGLRALRKNPGFTLVAVTSLALGIGANTAVFTLVNAALIKPLPYPGASRIVSLMEHSSKGAGTAPVHPRSFVEWHDRVRSFEALAIAQSIPINTDGADGAEQIAGMWASSEIFRVFGVAPLLGRTFSEEEAQPNRSPTVVLGNNYWQKRFGADPNILGKSIRIQDQAGTIVGVMPPAFRIGTVERDVYFPLPLNRAKPEAVGSRAFQCYGRLKPGVSLESARAEIATIAAEVGQEFEIAKGWDPVIVALRDQIVRDSRRILLLMLGVVMLVLLIACGNLASLLLMRGAGRRNELTLRAALGANRVRLLQQLLIESVVLSLSGGCLGVILGLAASRTLARLANDAIQLVQMDTVAPDWRVLLFGIALSVVTGIVFGLVPAWQLSRFDLQSGLREVARGVAKRTQQTFRAALIVGEIALAVVLLVGAGLFARTFSELQSVKLGFQPEHVLTLRMLVTGNPARRAALVNHIQESIDQLPEVKASGTIQFLPLTGMTNRGPFHFVGRNANSAGATWEADTATVGGSYFSAMGIPVRTGRVFDPQDRIGSRRVALVNQAFVDRYCAHQDPVGLVAVGDWSSPEPVEIVGVVGDIRHDGLTAEPRPTFYLSQAQSPGYFTYLIVRTQAEPAAVASAIQREIHRVEPAQPVTDVKMMQQYVSATLVRPRLYTMLVGTFSTLALMLAGIGLYGLVAFAVKEQTRDIGVRIALGANASDVLRPMMGQAVRLAAIGLTIGIIVAVWISRYVASFLYGVRPNDPFTYISAVAVLGIVALAATYVPARRATRIDPMVALRES